MDYVRPDDHLPVELTENKGQLVYITSQAPDREQKVTSSPAKLEKTGRRLESKLIRKFLGVNPFSEFGCCTAWERKKADVLSSAISPEELYFIPNHVNPHNLCLKRKELSETDKDFRSWEYVLGISSYKDAVKPIHEVNCVGLLFQCIYYVFNLLVIFAEVHPKTR